MKFAIAAALVASASAFAPMAPVVSRTTSLGYSVHVFNEDEGIDATFDCADDVFLVGKFYIPVRPLFCGLSFSVMAVLVAWT